jgi:hypothetical protein
MRRLDLSSVTLIIMPSQNDAERDQSLIGLCADCRNGRRIQSDRGSVFWMCQLSVSDARFPKYPRLPVTSCPGYLKKIAEPGDTEH